VSARLRATRSGEAGSFEADLWIYFAGGAVSLDATRRLNFQTPFSRTKVSS
jgi:hypothetical protein